MPSPPRLFQFAFPHVCTHTHGQAMQSTPTRDGKGAPKVHAAIGEAENALVIQVRLDGIFGR